MPLRDRLTERQIRILIALSRLHNVVRWDGHPDESTSQVVARNRHDPRYRWWVWLLERDEGHLDWALEREE